MCWTWPPSAVNRDEQRVDVAARDRQAEVVADEPHRAVGVVARQLTQAADRLARLLRVPAGLGDPHVAPGRRGAAPGVLVGLQPGSPYRQVTTIRLRAVQGSKFKMRQRLQGKQFPRKSGQLTINCVDHFCRLRSAFYRLSGRPRDRLPAGLTCVTVNGMCQEQASKKAGGSGRAGQSVSRQHASATVAADGPVRSCCRQATLI